MKKRILFVNRIIQSVVLVLITAIAGWGQAGTSSITGAVADAQGNAVTGATVTLIGDQGSRRTATTSENGSYTFSSIQPGTYQIEVEAAGFKKSSISAFQALVDKSTVLNVSLEIGAVTETVTVDATGIESIVNTQDASLGNNFVAKQIVDLPLDARNVANLLSLQAGVTRGGSVTGSRSDQANITLDGIDVNNQQQGTAFTPVLRVNPDSIEEFRVTTSNPNATQGRSAGAQISLVTRSGTNDFHGALYEYHRNTITSANDYFNNLSGIERPKLLRNTFGGRLGGPIIKDRLFFFYNYEGFREAKDVSVVNTVPLASLGQGTIKFRDSANNLITLNAAQVNALTSGGAAVVDVNPAALAILAGAASRYPANDFTVGDGLNTAGYRFNAPAPVKENAHTARFDWNVTRDQSQQISVRGNYFHDLSTTLTRVQAFPDTPSSSTWYHPIGISASHTWLINQSLTNRINYGLTRLALSDQGDSAANFISFRDVFQPFNFVRQLDRVNPTHNITDDVTWVKGNHTLQFGTNIRIVRNKRTNASLAYDSGTANFGFYQGSGGVLLTPLNDYLRANGGTTVNSGSTRSAQGALTAVLGRLSQYTANFNYGIDGQPLPAGSPNVREWATEEYDVYAQDIWKLRPNVTLTLGLRYGLSRPVYETQGFQVAPNIPLQDYFERRLAAAKQGQNYTDPLILDLAGPKNGKPGFYKLDKNNFQPRLAVAWQPKFESGFLASLFGREQESTIRGGFAITNDYFGQQLAVTFDANNTLGFSTARQVSANTFNITNRPAPLITAIGQSIRDLPNITVPGALVYPQQQPANFDRRIESSLDTNLVSPINYSWNVSYGRELPGKMYVDVSYVGRIARNLLATRDVMLPNNLTEPQSGQTYYQAATALELQRRAGVPISQIQALPFFERLYSPGSLAVNLDYPGLTNTQAVYQLAIDVGGTDWSTTQDLLDQFSGKRLFYQNQYAALSSFGTIASSDYHAGLISIRQRLRGLTWDFNYTLSKSIDDASGLQTSTPYASAFILNSILQKDNRAVSDFDQRHIINFNSVWEIPIGRDRRFLSSTNKFVNALIGGWQLTSVFRYNSGVPVAKFFDDAGWVTNWNIKSGGVRIQDLQSTPSSTGGTDGGGNRLPNLFSNTLAAYRSFRSPLPGETGDRNQLRFPSYFALDAGLYKSFGLPWSENHRLQFRWEVFNVTNSARLTTLADFSLGYQPNKGNPPASWANLTEQQGSPRVMQFALRYDF